MYPNEARLYNKTYVS